MRKIHKINTIMIVMVIVGSFFANVNVFASIMPKREILKNENTYDNQIKIDNEIDFDYETVSEIDRYFRKEADCNDVKISTTVYSTGLLYEIENSLIIIGHGYYDSNNQYYIADYSANRISSMVENKEFVAELKEYLERK